MIVIAFIGLLYLLVAVALWRLVRDTTLPETDPEPLEFPADSNAPGRDKTSGRHHA